MKLKQTKWLVQFMVACFAILQLLQPFIHAHLDTQHPIKTSNFHVVSDHEETFQGSNLSADNSLFNSPHPTHVASVDSSIKSDIKFLISDESIQFILFCLIIVLALQSVSSVFFPLTTHHYLFLKKRLPASRAPPKF